MGQQDKTCLSPAARDAALKWLNKGTGGRRKASAMSPMDELSWFEEPIMRTVQSSGSIVTFEACKANPRRVVLLFAQPAGSTVRVGLNPNGIIATAAGFIPPSIGFLEITQRVHGPLCQAQWFIYDSFPTTSVMTVVEILLRDWPQG